MTTTSPQSPPTPETPYVPFHGLEVLWFQSGGTLCNLRCTHCFISCAPDNHTFEFMTRAQVRRYLDEASEIGTVREIYHTGGEPFINPGMVGILEDSLALAPTTVLTNGTRIDADLAWELASLRDRSGRELTLRVSLDSADPEQNDAMRGPGVFERALRGMQHLADEGFEPIVTMMRWWDCPGEDEKHVVAFKRTLADRGIPRARVKILPALRMGAEVTRSRGYNPNERVTTKCVENFDFRARLQCSTCRMVTARGVWVCPILVEDNAARMGASLRETFERFPLDYQACYTCVASGLTCSNAS